VINIKENDEHSLNLALYPSCPVSVSLDFPCKSHASFAERLPYHCQGLSCNTEICIKFDTVALSDV
jgi:hypothetical protein